jgi:two-component sensor histidine kinase
LKTLEISQGNQLLSILESSDLYLDNKNLTKEEIVNSQLLKPYNKPIINVAQSKRTVWIHFKLKNSSSQSIQRALILNSPSLEYISLYTEPSKKARFNGIFYNHNHSTVYYSYLLKIPPQSEKEYYLRVASTHKSFFFKLTLQEYEQFRRDDILNQAPRILMLGILLGLMIYAFLLAFYSRDKSYFFYGMYLFFTLCHQVTFLGLTQIYFPHWFVLFDMKLVIVKLGLALFSAILFALSFLKIKSNTWLYKIYMVFLFISLLIIFIIKTLSIVLIIGVLFVLFNLISGIIIYQEGQKQARLFIFGFGVVSISYIMVVLDSFGFTSFLDYMPNILMWAFTIEILALTLAFADRYKILQELKDREDKGREEIIKNEVINKTQELNKALKIKSLLLKEVHHRVKNNLQIILSMIRLQSDKVKEPLLKNNFLNLENRINAIAKTYNLLIVDENLEEIDMEEYIESLVLDIKTSISTEISKIDVELDISVTLPLQKSVYIGIIINELITNTYKYAFENKEGTIFIGLHKEESTYTLMIKDNGKGFVYNKENSTSLGLKLIQSLVQDQLKGVIVMQTEGHTHYTIRFS